MEPNLGANPENPRPERSVPVGLLLLSMPMIASMISRTVMSFVDFVMVSRLGAEAQAAIMPAGVLLFCVMAFGIGVVGTVSSFVSQALGKRRPEDCAAYAWQGLFLSLAIGAVVMPAWLVVDDLFVAVGHAPDVQAMEIVYVRIGLIGLGPSLAAMALANFFNGIHRPMVGFWAAAVGNLFNGLANYALIFGKWGAPEMGIAGAAWGTVAAAALQTLILLAWMLKPAIDRVYHSRANWRPRWDLLRRMLRFGMPAGLQFSVDIAAFTVFTLLLVGRFGTEQLAAHNLVFKLLEVSFMPAVGMGMAVQAAVGKAIGAGDAPRARRTVRWATAFAVGYMGALALAYLAFRYPLASALTDSPQVIDWAVKLLIFCAVFQIFDAIGITHGHALQGAGDTRWQAGASAALVLLVLVGGGYAAVLLRPQWGAVGPWAAATAYIVLLGSVLGARWWFGPWESIQLIEPDDRDDDPPGPEPATGTSRPREPATGGA